MRTLWHAISHLSGKQKIIVGFLLLVIIMTWLAVCVILGSYLV